MMAYNSDTATQIKTVKRRVNVIQKWREPDGAWGYRVLGKGDIPIAEVYFPNGRHTESRLTNTDLLEIVRDRLEALNASPSGSFRSSACLQHVIEALMWADVPSFVGHAQENEPDKGDEING